MSRALGEYMITGIKTTIPFQQEIMRNADFQRGNYPHGILWPGCGADPALFSPAMNSRLFDHLDLRVSSIAAARSLYDAFLPRARVHPAGARHGDVALTAFPVNERIPRSSS